MHCLNYTIIGLKTAIAAFNACRSFAAQSFAHRGGNIHHLKINAT
jgi:hypothetical protein